MTTDDDDDDDDDDARPVNLLIIDDGELEVMNIRRAFRDSPNVTSITVARDGAAGLRLLQENEISRDRLLVLLDIDMPGMNGLEFLRYVRDDAELSSLTIVMLTSSDDPQDRADAYELHVAGYMIKPVTRAKFTECMQSLEQYWTRMRFS